jgi:nucleotide-binding universal stress UspA family protein
VERELEQVRQDLAGRVITLYFKHDSKHLQRVKHALRDLPREFDARLIDARQAILLESYDAQSPRRTLEPVLELKPPAQGPKAEKAAEVVKSDAAEKLMPVEVTRELSRRAIELVEANSSKVEPPAVARPVVEEPSPTRTKPVLPDWFIEDLEKSRQKAQRPAQEHADEPRTVQRSIGRPGAPRWGALAPTPTKIRRVSRLQPSEPEDATENVEPHPRE